MTQTIAVLRQVRELKENLQVAGAMVNRHKSNMGQLDQEELARLDSKANGKAYNAKDWDLSDKNGEQ